MFASSCFVPCTHCALKIAAWSCFWQHRALLFSYLTCLHLLGMALTIRAITIAHKCTADPHFSQPRNTHHHSHRTSPAAPSQAPNMRSTLPNARARRSQIDQARNTANRSRRCHGPARPPQGRRGLQRGKVVRLARVDLRDDVFHHGRSVPLLCEAHATPLSA